jgi:hypothetical protein
MSDLLSTVIDAHGGLERFNQLDAVSARLIQSGAEWALKGQEGVLDDVYARASLHQERESHHPFGAPDRRSSFTPGRVAIETTDGDVVEAMDQPRASFAGHTLETPWTRLQLAYFVGTAMWTYLTQPFTFALPGFHTIELEPWQENGEQWRRLQVTYPSYLATHSTEQTLYFAPDGLIRRHDYDVEIQGGSRGAHYISDYTEVAGIMVPTKHRIYPRTPDGQALDEPLLISIDVSEIAFT